jgi:RNA polymerase sigma factor (sigma-70 family)
MVGVSTFRSAAGLRRRACPEQPDGASGRSGGGPDRVAEVGACFERIAHALFRYFAVRVGDADLVDDLMQQLWLRARLSAEAVRGADPEPWLWQIARNLLRETYRRRDRERARGGAVADAELARQLAEQLDTTDLPETVLAQREVRDQLLLALTALPSEPQELLIAFYFDGRSHADLARCHQVSERAIEGRMYRARLALREQLAHLELEGGS